MCARSARLTSHVRASAAAVTTLGGQAYTEYPQSCFSSYCSFYPDLLDSRRCRTADESPNDTTGPRAALVGNVDLGAHS